ncbi:hypothetical protein CerSpe_003900 [Prunus speciosa]
MASSSSSSSSSSAGVLSFPNFSTLISTKLSETNYLLWESQVQPYVIGQKFWRFIDGSHPCPPAVLTPTKDKAVDADPVVPVPNPEYLTWYQTDQSFISILRSTLTEPVLAQVVGLTTSQAV